MLTLAFTRMRGHGLDTGSTAAVTWASTGCLVQAAASERSIDSRNRQIGGDLALPQAIERWLQRHPDLALPGHGETLSRWRVLAAIAAEDVCLAKILEAHYDALAIIAEIAPDAVDAAGTLCAVWAAEPPDAVVNYAAMAERWGTLSGTKAWCSGADLVSHALVTVHEGGARRLVHVPLHQAGVSEVDDSWRAVGMSRVNSGRVGFYGARAVPVGALGAYLDRPGFWHGGAGIAACWHGAAVAIAERLRRDPRAQRDALTQVHLGAVDMTLHASRSILVALAALIDRRPREAHTHDVIRARSIVERACVTVMDHVGRALGPGPLCADADHARRCADLSVFIRQSHADRDWQQLGSDLARGESPWTL